MSEAQVVMARVAAKHSLRYDEFADQFGSAFQCLCGWQPDEEDAPDNDFEAVDLAHGYHLAAEIDKALGGLTQEWLAVAFDARGHGYQVHRTAKNVDQLSSRWVSGWSEVQP